MSESQATQQPADGGLPPQQLLMRIRATTAAALPHIPLPAGYHERGYQPGDEPAWGAVLDSAGFEGWDTDQFAKSLAAPERLAGSRLILHDDTITSKRHWDNRSR